MKILVACEESQAVTIELRRLGHEAYSCDLQMCSGGHPEWHIQGDVLALLNGRCAFKTAGGVEHEIVGRWDMIIAFPPCTKTSNAGAKHLFRGGILNIQRYYEGLCGKALFMAIWAADCDKVAIENPTPSKVFDFPNPTQSTQPCDHGHEYSKKTLLWTRGLPTLLPSKKVNPKQNCHDAGTWFMKGGKERQKNRAKTPHGLAVAMAEQWAGQA